ncbi:hypothetical protein P9112_001787 [Eukaryota sp. TZLM1-RC]
MKVHLVLFAALFCTVSALSPMGFANQFHYTHANIMAIVNDLCSWAGGHTCSCTATVALDRLGYSDYVRVDGSLFPGYAAVQNLWNHLKSQGFRDVDPTQLQAGDIMFASNGGKGDYPVGSAAHVMTFHSWKVTGHTAFIMDQHGNYIERVISGGGRLPTNGALRPPSVRDDFQPRWVQDRVTWRFPLLQGPSSDRVLGYLTPRQEVLWYANIKRFGSWGLVSVNGEVGWVDTQYLTARRP